MADQWHGGQSSTGERWNVNLPAVVGVVFVFLLGVVVWVIASSGGDDPDSVRSSDSTMPIVSTTVAPIMPPPTTSPQPMPVTTPATPTVPATVAPTAPPTAPPAAPPPTAAPVAPPATPAPTTPEPTTPLPTAPSESGDLGVPGHPIQRPPCDGAYITVIASAIGDEATPASLGSVLDRHAGSNYLRTDLTCRSLTQSVDGEPVYVIYFGPFTVDADACTARADGPDDSYVRRLSNDLTPSHTVSCN